MSSRSHRSVAAAKGFDGIEQSPSQAIDAPDGDSAPMPLSTQVPLFRASQLEAAQPRPRRRLAGLKTLLGALDARRGSKPLAPQGPANDPPRLRNDLWLDSFFDE